MTFAREANEEQAIIDALKNVILLKIDCEKEDGPELAQQFGVFAYPTYAMINAEGKYIDRWLGYSGPDAFAEIVVANTVNPEIIDRKKDRFAATPDAPLARKLGEFSAASGENVTAVDYFKQAQTLDPATAGEVDLDILDAMSSGYRRDEFTVDEIFAAADRVVADPERPVMDLIMVYFNVSGAAEDSGQQQRLAPYLEVAVARSEGSTEEDVVGARGYLLFPHALYVEKDPEKAIEIKRGQMPEGWQEDPGRLNSFAWACFEANTNLEEGLQLALKGAELADEGRKANIIDTAADIAFRMGDAEQAITLIRQAIEMKPERQYFKDQLAKFEGSEEG